jgi:hypothetical protein
MALQRVGQVDMDLLLEKIEAWAAGNWLEMRAAAAGLAEPTLLQKQEHILRALEILDRITSAVESAQQRDDPVSSRENRMKRDEDFKILCKGLGYCWSVVVVALPAQGKQAMERWFSSPDKDVRRIMKENLKKNRLVRMDKAWVEACFARLAG